MVTRIIVIANPVGQVMHHSLLRSAVNIYNQLRTKIFEDIFHYTYINFKLHIVYKNNYTLMKAAE